ncbi:hypothetical protein BaRGS_00014775 [Batillaria attramentaria]|uniref:Complex I assembly factor TIMMDC1, mitochondrial n=1 Tax=Batillaria attramentaria TaxID=370345 RepID=A0ABD0L3T2_9CAEN
MDVNEMQRCMRRYKFLSPRLTTQGFSHTPPRTHCHLSQPTVPPPQCDNTFPKSVFARWWKSLPSRKVSCEGDSSLPTATDRMERAHSSVEQRNSNIVSEVEIQNYLAQESGEDRLRKMFSKNYLGQWSPELQFIYHVTLQTSGMTFLCMFVLAGRQAKNEFIERNRVTVFKTRFQAARRLQDTVFLFGMKEGFKWAVRVSLFTMSFLLISQSIAVYRNKSSVWEYSFASAVTIGAMKASLGLRGFLVGTGFGALMGSLAGLLAMGAMKLANETQEQRHYWQIQKELETEKYDCR